MKQFSAPTIKCPGDKMIVSNNDKVCCPSLPQPGEFGWEKKERWMDPRYDKRSTCFWSNRPIGQVRVSKEPILKHLMPLTEIRLELHLPLFLLWQWWFCEKCMWSHTDTLRIEYEDSDSEEQKIRKSKFVEKYDFQFRWKGINVSTLCIKYLLPVTWPRRGVGINYLLSKTSQNIETDCSLFQNSHKRPFSVVLLFSLVVMQGSVVQKCRQH